MTTETNPVYVRIQKLLALANSPGATEAERDLAAEYVQRLLQDHQLTLSQVEAAGQQPATKRERRATGSGERRSAMYRWQRDLMAALSECNFCLHSVVESRVWGEGNRRALHEGEMQRYQDQKQHVLVGRELNVRVTLDTFDYLFEAIFREARAAGHDTLRRTQALSWFCEGASARLTERLRFVRRAREQEQAATSGNGTHRELVLADAYSSEQDLNLDFKFGYPAGTTAARRREREARFAAQQAEEQRLVAEGMDPTEAWYKARGYAQPMPTATPSRRRARGTGWTQANEEHWQKVNSPQYAAGKEAGDQISLDPQIGREARPALPRT
jgi:hypothetical protein